MPLKDIASLFKIEYKEPKFNNLPQNQQIGSAFENFFKNNFKNPP